MLHVELDAPLPERVGAGAPVAVFVAGWCVHPQGRVAALELTVDGAPQPLTTFGAPRLDVFRALHPTLDPYATGGIATDPDSADDPGLHGYRSGFWGHVRLPALPDRATVHIGLRGGLDSGTPIRAELGTITAAALPSPLPLPAGAGAGEGPLIAVCMATHDPDPVLVRRQLGSIRAQEHTNWVCVVSDDGSRPERLADLRDAIGDDPRFLVTQAPSRLGFYRNFERALALAPVEAAFVALADQDDDWRPDKLGALLAAIGDAQLAYSDARVVTEDGTVVSDTYWARRRNNHDDLLSLLVANAVTGAASLLRRPLLDDALPFPPAQFAHYHDHWLGLVARARAPIAYVDRPLYDYVQHGAASLGHAAANRMRTLRDRVGGLKQDPREKVRMWRLHYFADVCRIQTLALTLDARVGDRMDRAPRRALSAWLRAAGGGPVGQARLWARGARELSGRPETLGAEWMLGYALAWRRLLAATTRERPQRGLRLDAVPPASLVQHAGASTPPVHPEVRVVADKLEPLRLALDPAAPARVNLLLPSIDLAHFFGGYIGKFNLASRLAAQGLRVRIVTTDPVPALPPSWRESLEAFAGLEGVLDRVELAFGRESNGLEVSPGDRWIATTWWTAHIADAARRELGGPPFLYLIQEHEPFTFPMGTWAALAEQSYRFEHRALFSTELLRDWFRLRGLGVFAGGSDAGSAAFRNAITPVPTPSAAELRADGRRLLFYARPEPHAARNLFELGTLALREAVRAGVLDGWTLRGIGTTALGRQLSLGDGAALELMPRTAQSAYAAVLREHDVGLSLMHTPHPSLVPIEMASAGMRVVTSTFENKTAAALAAISPNLIGAEPTIAGIVDALAQAVDGAADVDARAAGARVDWPSDWAAAFDDALVARVRELLDA